MGDNGLIICVHDCLSELLSSSSHLASNCVSCRQLKGDNLHEWFRTPTKSCLNKLQSLTYIQIISGKQ